MESTEAKFDQWAVVSLFGHHRLAGRVTEQAIGGASFVRIDVPATSKQPAFTELFGQKAIYSISPVSEEVATMIAEKENRAPITAWDVPAPVKQSLREHLVNRQSTPLLPGAPPSRSDDVRDYLDHDDDDEL